MQLYCLYEFLNYAMLQSKNCKIKNGNKTCKKSFDFPNNYKAVA